MGDANRGLLGHVPPTDDEHANMKLNTLVRTGLLTAVIDGLFACVLSVVFYHTTVTRLWQGVASVPLGTTALDGGTATALIGVALHVCVAFTWSAVFLYGAMRLDWMKRLLASRYGVLKAAAIYGPFVWLVMSAVVIPVFTHRPPSITFRWWVQLLGHVPFVALPIAWSVSKSESPEVSAG